MMVDRKHAQCMPSVVLTDRVASLRGRAHSCISRQLAEAWPGSWKLTGTHQGPLTLARSLPLQGCTPVTVKGACPTKLTSEWQASTG